jgi:hypothetical protein
VRKSEDFAKEYRWLKEEKQANNSQGGSDVSASDKKIHNRNDTLVKLGGFKIMNLRVMW